MNTVVVSAKGIGYDSEKALFIYKKNKNMTSLVIVLSIMITINEVLLTIYKWKWNMSYMNAYWL